MAERIDRIAQHGRARYPWDEWLDGSAWRISRGVDFDCPVNSMASIIYQRAARGGLTVVVRQRDDSVELQVVSTERTAAA